MSGQTRVYVDMVGDLFHAGHVELLRDARTFGDWLVVGVLSDHVAAANKRRPIMTLPERVSVVRACRHVDAVADELNGRPRKTLGFMTPSEKFNEAVALTR